MSQTNIKVGVIGAGHWGKNIVKTFNELNVLTAVADADDGICKEIASQYPDINIYHSAQELLQDESIDAVAIATPAITHVDLVVAAIQANKHVFVEKPLATNSEQITTLEKHASDYNKTIMVGHMLLYQPAITFIKTFIDTGKLGKVFSLRQVRRNLGTVREHENAMYSLGVHDIAVLQYLVNETPEKCHAVGQAVIRQDIEDDISVHIRYQNGVRAHIHATWLWPFKQRELMVIGEHGSLYYDELKQEVRWFKNTVIPEKKVEGSDIVFTATTEPLKLELAHFIDCCVTGNQPLSDLRQGIIVADILETISGQLSDERFKLQQTSDIYY